jgi:hypothetical protein
MAKLIMQLKMQLMHLRIELQVHLMELVMQLKMKLACLHIELQVNLVELPV